MRIVILVVYPDELAVSAALRRVVGVIAVTEVQHAVGTAVSVASGDQCLFHLEVGFVRKDTRPYAGFLHDFRGYIGTVGHLIDDAAVIQRLQCLFCVMEVQQELLFSCHAALHDDFPCVLRHQHDPDAVVIRFQSLREILMCLEDRGGNAILLSGHIRKEGSMEYLTEVLVRFLHDPVGIDRLDDLLAVLAYGIGGFIVGVGNTGACSLRVIKVQFIPQSIDIQRRIIRVDDPIGGFHPRLACPCGNADFKADLLVGIRSGMGALYCRNRADRTVLDDLPVFRCKTIGALLSLFIQDRTFKYIPAIGSAAGSHLFKDTVGSILQFHAETVVRAGFNAQTIVCIRNLHCTERCDFSLCLTGKVAVNRHSLIGRNVCQEPQEEELDGAVLITGGNFGLNRKTGLSCIQIHAVGCRKGSLGKRESDVERFRFVFKPVEFINIDSDHNVFQPLFLSVKGSVYFTKSSRIGEKMSSRMPASRHTQPCSMPFFFSIVSPAVTMRFSPPILNSNLPDTT